jgi:Mn2+/Fe2+ NRAMP family transporter
MAHPHWIPVLKETFLPSLAHITPFKAYIFMVINVIGTTITPWGQFYIQSTVRDKGVKAHEFKMLRADVLFGAFFTNFIAFFIIVCCGALLYPNQNFADAGRVALALRPLAGPLATVFFAIGLLNASCFGAITVPLSTAYAFTESLGWESGVGRQIKEAPLFVGIFTFLLVASVLIVMFFPNNLTSLIILPNIVGGVLLPIIMVLMLLLVNKRRLMGSFVNSPAYNAIAWATTIIIAVLSLILLVSNLLPS